MNGGNQGIIIVGTKVDTTGIDKGISAITSKMRKIEQKAQQEFEVDGVKVSGGWNLSKEEQEYYDRLSSSLSKLQQKKQEILDLENQSTGAIKEQAIEQKEILNGYGQWVDDVYITADGTKYVRKETNELNEEIKEANNNYKKMSSTLQSVTKKIIRWGFYIFGIRSAYMGLRKVISTVEKENENIAMQLKVLGNAFSTALANVLAPVVQKIINLLAKLMFYIDYIYYRLTSKHLFDFSKAFSDASKSSKETAGNVGKISRQLAGFDEMNVLSDNSAGGGVGAGGGTTAFDNPFEGWKNFKVPKWLEIITKILEWFKKHWKAVVIGILAIGAAFLIFKAIDIVKKLKGVKEAGDVLKNAKTDFTGFFNSLGKGIEAIAILGNITLVIKAVTDMIEVFGQSGLKVTDVLGLMATIVGSLVVLITSLTIASQALQSPTAMAGLVVLTASISAILLVVKKTLPTILDALSDFMVRITPTINDLLDTMGKNIALIIDALGITLPPIIRELGNLFDKIFGGIDKIINTVGNTIVKIMNTAKSLIIEVLNAILDFINKLGPAINNFVDNAIKAITKLINFMISGIEYMINTLIIGAIRGFINKINNIIPGDSFDMNIPSYVSIQRFYPRLAKGGIVNMPGRGVPVGGAYAGERGSEGVIPLTDSQQMSLLGEAIGKYITVNLTNVTELDGRTIARRMQEVNNNTNFLLNR